MWSAREKWYNIGVRFKIGVQDLGVIGTESDVDTKFNQVIIKWLNRGVNCTWRTICDVLKNCTVDMEGLAINIGMIIINYIKYNYIYNENFRLQMYVSNILFPFAAQQYQESTSISAILPVQQQQSTTATSGASVIAPQQLSPTTTDIPIPPKQQSTSITPAPYTRATSSISNGQVLFF